MLCGERSVSVCVCISLAVTLKPKSEVCFKHFAWKCLPIRAATPSFSDIHSSVYRFLRKTHHTHPL